MKLWQMTFFMEQKMFWNSRIKDLECRVHNLETDMFSLRDLLPRCRCNKSTSLGKYLSTHHITQQKAAEGLGLTQATVSRIVNGSYIPSKENMLKIYTYTNGEVQPNDFYGVSNG